jgi:predicted dehydrogenase
MPQAGVWNVAIAGCGIGRTHIARGYARRPDKFRVVALCDVDAARLAAVADEFGIARRTTAFDELLRIDDVDISISAPRRIFTSRKYWRRYRPTRRSSARSRSPAPLPKSTG